MQAELKQVIYVSEKTDFSDNSLTNIFDTSEKNNPEKGITGCLLIGSNSYLQFLEGPSYAVEELYSKIKTDSRHKNVKKLHDQSIEEKLFSSWSMKFAPFNNLEWSNQEFDSGNFLNIKPEGARNVFQSINKFING
ncbi:BLUF domain-containing protein [Candidatus Puniceispirillum sp.]|nr:BLUF domain-containing protein [Candidatus Puniceispirillum sp.]